MATLDELSAEQRSNLDKLATYLEGLPVGYRHFRMSVYAKGAPESDFALRPRTTLRHCGTAACALGHGPASGVKLAPRYVHRQDDVWWSDYGWGAFGAQPGSPLFRFLFSPDWEMSDNHHHGAAKRIRWILAGNPPLEVGDLSYQQVAA